MLSQTLNFMYEDDSIIFLNEYSGIKLLLFKMNIFFKIIFIFNFIRFIDKKQVVFVLLSEGKKRSKKVNLYIFR
jgi:hypothetical protein